MFIEWTGQGAPWVGFGRGPHQRAGVPPLWRSVKRAMASAPTVCAQVEEMGPLFGRPAALGIA